MHSVDTKPIRVLHVLTGLTTGGAETFILNMYRNMDRSKVQFDFLLRSNDNVYKEELDAMGSRVYYTASFPKNFIRNAIETSRFFKYHKYDIVHVHANALLYMFALKCAKKYGVKCRIIHSHNTAMAHMKLRSIHYLNKCRIRNMATDFFACSVPAGKWMFDGDFRVINNAVDFEMFLFNQKKRNQIRCELGISEEDLVIGHIGRFVEQKNHAFLIDIFSEVVKKKTGAKLVLVGDGILKHMIEEKVTALGLADAVCFLGARKDAAEILNAFDLFLFPSKYEGLAIAPIEAQANGLKIVCSEAIPDDALFDSSMRKLSLETESENWAQCIVDMDIRRLEMKEKLQKAGYDIKQEAKKLQEFYLSKAGK